MQRTPDTQRPTVACDYCAGKGRLLFRKHGDSYVRCVNCGLIYLDPQPSEAELAEIYGEHYYDAWGVGDAEAEVARLKRLTFGNVLARLTARTGIRDGDLLDLGCASGFLLEEARARGFSPWGVELNVFSARRASEKIGADRIHCGTLEDAPFSADCFNVVVMSDLLEHVRSPRSLLQRVVKILRPGGAVVVLAPDAGGLSRRLLGKHWTDFKREHLFSFDRSTLRALLEQASLSVEDLRAFPKYLDLDYVHRQLTAYPTPLFTPMLKVLRFLAPKAAARLPVPIFAGSMLAIARKPGSRAARPSLGVEQVPPVAQRAR